MGGKKVLVLGTDDRVILAVVRSLGRKGLCVHLGWCAADSIAARSRYVKQVHTIPAYSAQSDAWIQALRSLLERENFDLVIPCNDSTLVPLVANRDSFSEFDNIYLLPDDVFNVVSDKFNTFNLAQSLKINLPHGEIVDGAADAGDLAKRFGLPLVMKPQATITVGNVGLANVVRKVHSVEEAQAFLNELGEGQVLVQENFVGRGVGVEMLVHEGRVLVSFQHRRIHETVEWGSTYRESAEVNPELLNAAERFMAACNYTGVAMAEFIVNAAGRWVFLEINGRFWGSLPLAVAAGADFPYYLYQMLAEGRREFPRGYRRSVRCRNLLLDYRWLKDRRRGLGKLLLPLSAARQLCLGVYKRDRLDSFAFDDPRPQFCELAKFAGMALEKVLQRSKRSSTELRAPQESPMQPAKAGSFAQF